MPDWGLADDLVWGLNICGLVVISKMFPCASCAHLRAPPAVLRSADSGNCSVAEGRPARSVDE
eukprot:10240733-Karenia_brevis.AAC.1